MELLSKRRVGTLALGLVMSFGLVACGGDTAPTATSVPVAAPTNTTAAAAAPTNTTAAAAPTNTTMAAEPTATTASGTGSTGSMTGPSAEIEAAVKGMKDVKTYHMEIMNDAAGMSTTMNADVDATNKNLRISTMAAGQTSNIIVIGNDAYVSMDGGKTYMKDPTNGAMAEGIKPFLTMWDSMDMGSAGTPAPEGAIKAGTPATETLDGVETHHWIIDSAAMSGGSGTGGSAEMWVTVGANPTIRQMKTSSTAAGTSTSTTIKWSKINEDLKIEAPTVP